jgi:preprotein translocase subunit SecE
VSKVAAQRAPKIWQRIVDYFKDTRGELRKVTWPTRDQATKLTAIVLGMTVVMAIFLGAVDFVFATLVRLIVAR